MENRFADMVVSDVKSLKYLLKSVNSHVSEHKVKSILKITKLESVGGVDRHCRPGADQQSTQRQSTLDPGGIDD